MSATRRGRFVAFEGGEASGKSTQARRLAEALGAVLTREPGGTPVGERIRELVLDPGMDDLADRTEALLMAAGRAQHVAEIIEPALAEGRDVVTDRFIASSIAYQGYGRGLDAAEVLHLSLFATVGLQPDVVVLLDVPEAVASARLPADRDRLEAAGRDFHRAVVEGFHALAAGDPERWVVIDGTGAPEDIAIQVRAAVTGHPRFQRSTDERGSAE